MGHGFDSLEQQCAYFKRLRNFLSRHLDLLPVDAGGTLQ
jgi:hypothetical protein